jgi:hypothetical protein
MSDYNQVPPHLPYIVDDGSMSAEEIARFREMVKHFHDRPSKRSDESTFTLLRTDEVEARLDERESEA